MPSLGSATFALYTESAQFKSGLVAAERQAAASATGIAASFKRAGASVAAIGTKSVAHAGLVGLAALYETVKEGTHTLAGTQRSLLLVESAIKTTGGAAHVTAQHAEELSKAWEKVTGAHEGETLNLEQLLLRFRNVRNEVGAGNAVFDRTVTAIENVTAATGRGLVPTTIALGKALQDPSKYLNMLARSGITFTKQQVAMVKQLQATHGVLAAQTYILDQLDKRYRGAAQAAGKSFAGQLKIARAELDESAALIVKALIPAFVKFVGILKTVAGVVSQHTTVVKDLLFAYLAWKGAMIAVGIVVKLNAGYTKLLNGYLKLTGAAAVAGADEADGAMTGLEAILADISLSIKTINVQLESMGASAAVGAGAAAGQMRLWEGELAGVTTTATAAVTEMGTLKLGLAGLAGTVIPIAIALSFVRGSTPGQKVLDQVGLGWVGRLPLVGHGAQQAARAGKWIRGVMGNPIDTTSPTKQVQSEAAFTKSHTTTPIDRERAYTQAHSGYPVLYPQSLISSPPAKTQAASLDRQRQLRENLDRANQTNNQSAILKALEAFVNFDEIYIKKQEKLLKTDVKHRAVHADILHGLYADQKGYQDQIDSITKDAATKRDAASKKALAELNSPSHVLGSRFLNEQIKLEAARAESGKKSKTDQERILKQEEVTLRARIASGDFHGKQLLLLRTKLAQAKKTFDALVKKTTGSSSSSLIPANLRIALSVAERNDTANANSLKDNRDALQAQEDYLNGLLKNFKGTKDKRAKIQAEITRVINEIKGINKKISGSVGPRGDFASMERQFLSEQAGFWASFGSNVFTESQRPGGGVTRTPGSKATKVEVHQHFPAGPTPDHFRESRYALAAMSAAFDG